MKQQFNCTKCAISSLYTEIKGQNARYAELAEYFGEYSYNKNERYFFSAPGRIEICGNHTDHQNGVVLASAIECDAVAIAAKNDSNMIRIKSKGQKEFCVDVTIVEPVRYEQGKSSGLVRGIVAGFIKRGGCVGGLDICITSDVATGSGISSSAAFEVLVATVINSLYNDDKFDSYEIAAIGQNAEDRYFGKPCGLMDQMASAYGSSIMIDFNNEIPKVRCVSMDCIKEAMDIFLVHTGGTHSKLTKEYSSIVSEMKAAARIFNADRLIEVNEKEFESRMNEVRDVAGDRAVLRAMHFFAENKRVEQAALALTNKNANDFLDAINNSGDSSVLLLQNVYVDHIQNKSVALALAMTKKFLSNIGSKGACRIHGGGFLGTILAFIPKENSDGYKQFMTKVFGDNSVDTVRIREFGGICVCRCDK